MKLRIKRKFFSDRVVDESGKIRWYTKRLDPVIQVYDAGGNPAARFYRKPWDKYKYFIELDGHNIDWPFALVGVQLACKPCVKYHLVDLQRRIESKSNGFIMYLDDIEVMRIFSEWWSYHQLDIADPRDELLYVCIALAMTRIEAADHADRLNV